ncbi:4-hydroxyphenylpyruvate dioxygenase-like protein [Brachionichthys hirsutus]|uniref:4-hydroxyphenylpyruvate dioxygenase-like protein n=1 Tax=Brachionichthys hirsutus TaxID=412623 RepID=UPI0036053AD7
MATRLTRLHHVSLRVSNAEKLANDLVSKFKFNLLAARVTGGSRQVAVGKGAAVFVVNERLEARSNEQEEGVTDRYASDPHLIAAGKSNLDHSTERLYDAGPRHPVDTVSNVCFEVEDVERSFRELHRHGCRFLVPPTTAEDDHGRVTYSVLQSVVGNVCHTLIDRTRYKGGFLPGFDALRNDGSLEDEEEEEEEGDASCPITHFDHITYACPRNTTQQVMRWYQKFFGFRRFLINSEEDLEEGFVLNQEGVSLRLHAMEYWKCSKAGMALPFADQKEPDCKFVISESLPQQGSNQISTFLEKHTAAGIQHIGLYTDDIVSTARAVARAGVQFYSPPSAYYDEVGKQQEIEEAGHDPRSLAQHGILLDTELQQDPSSETAARERRRYLLQVFSKPIFAEDTFFLELIERRGAEGFGEGNIKALWRSVQAHMERGGPQGRIPKSCSP